MARLPFPDSSVTPQQIDDDATGYEDFGVNRRGPYDFMKINGVRLPGIVQVNAKAERAIDKRKNQGSPGASLSLKGWKPTTISINVYIWTPSHFVEMGDILDTIWPPPGKDHPKSLQVISPSLQAININAMIITSVGSLQVGRTPGEYLIPISATEYTPVQGDKKGLEIKGSQVNSSIDKNNATASSFTTAKGKKVNQATANSKKPDPRKNPKDLAPTKAPV